MKKILTYLCISATVLILFSCDKPAPTQLIDDAAEYFEVELLNKDLENEYYSSGADTSGITQDITGITNLISVSGVKITNENRTSIFSLAQAMFFDRTKPIRNQKGKLLAYKSITPGTIKYNGVDAHIVPFRIKYRENGIQKDTLIGNKYLLYNIFGGFPDPFYFSFNSSVSFEFDPLLPGSNVSFNIVTPDEINGSVSLSGSKQMKNLQAALTWNARFERRVTVEIGLIRYGQRQSIPVYRMKTSDDGSLQIPARLLNELPLDKFEKIVFTFVRSHEGYRGSGSNELLVSSQSIHSIVIDIP
jgi:hypothetical protein